MDFDLRLLRCAIALAEHRSFARAAASIHLSQPALSRAIKELEHRAGTRLFDRSSSGAEPTDAGNLFLEHAREVMSRASDLGREMNLLTGLETGELRIGAGTYPSNMFLDTAIARMMCEHPSVHLSICNDNWSNLVPRLRKREIDLAIIEVTAAETDPELQVIRLNRHRGHLVMRAGHPLFSAYPPRQLDESWTYPFVSTSRFPPAFFKELATALLGPRHATKLGSRTLVSVACESLSMMKSIVRDCDAVALLPLNVVAGEIERGELRAIPGPAWMSAEFGIVHLAHRSLSPLGRRLVRLAQDADEELLAWETEHTPRLLQIPSAEPVAIYAKSMRGSRRRKPQPRRAGVKRQRAQSRPASSTRDDLRS